MLPFIAGIAIGALGVVAYKNNDKIKEQVQKGASSAKKLTKEGLEKSKETIEYVKQQFEEAKLRMQERTEEKPKSIKKGK